MRLRTLLLAVIAGLTCFARYSPAAEKSAAELLPPTTVGYLEISEPKRLIGLILDHPLRKKVEVLDEYKKAWDGKEGQQLRAGILLAEFQLGMELRPAIEKLTGGGIVLAGDPATNGVALLVKATDPALLEKLRDTVLKLARDDAAGKGQPDPIKSAEYRGVKAYRVGEGTFAVVGPWLVVVNKGELGKKLLDNHLDGGPSLADNKYFQAARAKISGEPAAWGFVSLSAVRDAGVAKDLYKEKSDNPAVELLLGGMLGNLKQSPYATAAIYAETNQLRIAASTPHDPAWISKPREFYFGTDGKGAAPQPLEPKQTVLSLGTYRDLAAVWLAKSDLFDENVNAGLAQADNTLTTLFSGRDFGREILGAFRPEMQLVVTRQDYKGITTPEPDIKLPAGALVVQLKDEKLQQELRLRFKSLIGFINVASAQQGQPPLDFNDEKRGDATLVTSAYLPDKSGDGKINYNFSPSIGFIGDRMILSSTSRLAGELVDLVAKAKETPAVGGKPLDNTRAQLSVPVLKDILQDNRKHLVARNQIDKGIAREQAEKEIDTVLALLNAVRDVTMRLSGDGKNLNFELGLRLEPTK